MSESYYDEKEREEDLKPEEKERKQAEKEAKKAERKAEKEAKKAEKKEKKQGKGTWKFFLGLFIGILVALGSVAGIGFWAYKNLTISWINKTFKAGISINEKVDNMKMEDLINRVSAIASNYENYSINQLESDFGLQLPDEISGVSIIDLKGEKIKNFSRALEEKFDKITASELGDFIGEIKILEQEMTFYVGLSDDLYVDESCTVRVSKYDDFDFEFEGNDIIVKDKVVGTKELNDDAKPIVKIQLKDLPLTYGLAGFVEHLGDQMTIKDLEGYGVELDFLGLTEQQKEDNTINELEIVIKGLKVANFLGFTVDGANVYKDEEKTQPVTGIMKIVALKTINELSTFDFDGLKLNEVFDDFSSIEGALSLLDGNATIADLSGTLLTDTIKNSTVATLVSKKVISIDAADLLKTVPTAVTKYAGRTLGSLKLTELFEIIPSLFTPPTE